MKWWVYKCNSKEDSPWPCYGDWDDFFANPEQHWGASEHLPSLLTLEEGDMILAYQTDRNELVGTATVSRTCHDGGYLYLTPEEPGIRVKVRPLKQYARIAEMSAFQSGPVRTLYAITEDDAKYLLLMAKHRRSQQRKTRAFAGLARRKKR